MTDGVSTVRVRCASDANGAKGSDAGKDSDVAGLMQLRAGIRLTD
jgi:hypothetical protein